ncbi:MFS transporter [Nocardioides sp. cx-169]|uniref:MFS transporter n=1 Tax=Nocardioides sp. cx-169 TaxID=2899080 RepID=UPI001E42F463|nr:MFS transporter [Nocardioides sp. cx-169]MCD4533790.1 MFS transporter [Nocardioides sp. cx-169]
MSAPAASLETRPRSSPAVVVATLSLCGIVVSLQQTLLLPLLPLLPEYLDTTADSASWLVTATLLTGAVATPTISRLADMYGKRRMMALTLAITVLGSLLGALSDALPLLIGARALQGVGMAVVPVGIAIMRDELPRERVPLGVALMSATLAIGAGVGLPLSGLLVEHLDWHAIFWVTGLVGSALLVAALVLLPESPVRTQGAFDVRGAVLLTTALTAMLLALSKGAQWGWGSPTTLGLAVVGLAVLAFWIPLELRTPSPLVDIRVARRPAVLLVNVASVMAGFAMFINMLLTTQFLQVPKESGYGLGLDTLHTGLWMVPNAAAFGLMAPVSAWLIRRVGPQVTMIAGAAIMAVTYAARVFLSENLTQVVIGSVVVGVGTAMMYGAVPTLLMRAVPVTETASANGLNVLLRAFGTSTASATTAAITSASVITVGSQVLPSQSGLNTLLWLAAVASLCATLIGVPMLRMQDYAEEGDRSGAGRPVQVVRGQVLDAGARPIRTAVVTVLTPEGEPVDWGQADSDGWFNAAIPTAADYLVVTTADGWQPRSRMMHLDREAPVPPIVLRDRLRLAGVVTDGEGAPVIDALVVLTRHSGEAVATIRTDHEGRYEIPRPPSGRYVLTVVSRDGAIGARPITVWEAARDVDLVLGTPLA